MSVFINIERKLLSFTIRQMMKKRTERDKDDNQNFILYVEP